MTDLSKTKFKVGDRVIFTSQSKISSVPPGATAEVVGWEPDGGVQIKPDVWPDFTVEWVRERGFWIVPPSYLSLIVTTLTVAPPRMVHTVKSWCYLYSAALAGFKTHDFRDMTERDYKVGDHLHFREFDQTRGAYTGREALFEITYITDRQTPCAMSSCALGKDYGVLSIKLIKEVK